MEWGKEEQKQVPSSLCDTILCVGQNCSGHRGTEKSDIAYLVRTAEWREDSTCVSHVALDFWIIHFFSPTHLNFPYVWSQILTVKLILDEILWGFFLLLVAQIMITAPFPDPELSLLAHVDLGLLDSCSCSPCWGQGCVAQGQGTLMLSLLYGAPA